MEYIGRERERRTHNGHDRRTSSAKREKKKKQKAQKYSREKRAEYKVRIKVKEKKNSATLCITRPFHSISFYVALSPVYVFSCVCVRVCTNINAG